MLTKNVRNCRELQLYDISFIYNEALGKSIVQERPRDDNMHRFRRIGL